MIAIRKVILAVLFAIVSTVALAQFNVGLGLSGGIMPLRHKSFNRFAESWNSFYNGILDKPLKPFGLAYTQEVILSFRFSNALDLSAGFVGQRAKTDCDYTNGDQREFKFSNHLFVFEMGMGPGDPEVGWITFLLGFSFGNTVIDSWYIQSDGIKSIGQERYWNGSFSSFTVGCYPGIKASVGIRNVKLQLRADYMLPWFGGTQYRDRNFARLFSNTYSAEVLPTDVPTYYNDQLNYVNVADRNAGYVNNKFSGFRIQAGLVFELGTD